MNKWYKNNLKVYIKKFRQIKIIEILTMNIIEKIVLEV